VPGRAEPTRRVADIDDNQNTRRGDVASLAENPLIVIVADAPHDDALAWGADRWLELDVVVVDAARPYDNSDRPRLDDHFPGVKVVDRARTCNPDLLLVVLTGHFTNDALRRRMSEAGADFFHHRGRVVTAVQLQQVVLQPDVYRAGVPAVHNREVQKALGVDDRTRVNRFLEYLEAQGGRAALGLGERRSRVQERLRARAAADGVRTTNKTTGMPPGPWAADREQGAPSRRQIDGIWKSFAQIDEQDDDVRGP